MHHNYIEVDLQRLIQGLLSVCLPSYPELRSASVAAKLLSFCNCSKNVLVSREFSPQSHVMSDKKKEPVRHSHVGGSFWSSNTLSQFWLYSACIPRSVASC